MRKEPCRQERGQIARPVVCRGGFLKYMDTKPSLDWSRKIKDGGDGDSFAELDIRWGTGIRCFWIFI